MVRYNLFLDDFRIPRDAYLYTKDKAYLDKEWVIVANYEEFVQQIEARFKAGETLALVSFDHDLSDEHYGVPCEIFENYSSEQLDMAKTGYDCALWLTEFLNKNECPAPGFKCHSMNPVGKKNIEVHLGKWLDSL